MSNYKIIEPATYGERRWSRVQSYRFAADQQLLPIVADELHKAAITLPLAFHKNGNTYSLVALVSVGSGSNIFVDKEGNWLGAYVPAVLRAYPFQVAPTDKEGNVVLCFDEDSGLLSEDTAAESFFEPDGTPAPGVKKIFEFLASFERSRRQTARICELLADFGLLVPWELKVQSDTGEVGITGLFRVDEDKLNALQDPEFLKLRESSALQLVYSQLISMQNIDVLPRIMKLLARREAAEGKASVDLGFLNPDDGILDFGKLN